MYGRYNRGRTAYPRRRSTGYPRRRNSYGARRSYGPRRNTGGYGMRNRRRFYYGGRHY